MSWASGSRPLDYAAALSVSDTAMLNDDGLLCHLARGLLSSRAPAALGGLRMPLVLAMLDPSLKA